MKGGWKKKFSDEEEKVLAGWVVYKDLTHESSTTEKFHEFAQTYFGKTMSPTYVTTFMKRHHLSLKLPGNAKDTEYKHESIDEAVAFLENLELLINAYDLEPSQIKVCLQSLLSLYLRQGLRQNLLNYFSFSQDDATYWNIRFEMLERHTAEGFWYVRVIALFELFSILFVCDLIFIVFVVIFRCLLCSS
jgi:hypothetical protein